MVHALAGEALLFLLQGDENPLTSLFAEEALGSHGVAQSFIRTFTGTATVTPSINNIIAGVGDVNADGHDDIVCGIFDGSPHVSYWDAEAGGFQQPVGILDKKGERIVLNA